MKASQQLNKRKILYRASPRQRLTATSVCLAVIAFFGLFALAGHYKISPWPLPCGFKQKYNLPCPTCGMTTSVVAFAQGKIFESCFIQPAAGLFWCVVSGWGVFAFFVAVFGVYFGFLNRFFTEVKIKYIILALIVVIAAGWVVTLARALAAENQG
jgi:hypothetical protein